MRALVVIPTYNELGNLSPLVESVIERNEDFDALIIDDGSPDGTGLLAEHLKEVYPGRIEVIHRQGKLGLATAYLTGFRYGLMKGYDYLFEMDADFSHNPLYLPKFIETMAERNADVVLGSRYVAGGGVTRWPWYRKIISRGGSLYAGVLLGIPVKDVTGGFKCFSRKVLESINLGTVGSSGYGFQIEMTYRAIKAGFTVVEMPIVFEERREGTSKMSPTILIEALWMVPKLRVEASLRGVQETASDRMRS